jgi:hypothetical protein
VLGVKGQQPVAEMTRKGAAALRHVPLLVDADRTNDVDP